jgi:hypothetical protein
MKILLVGAEMFHLGGRTNGQTLTKLTATFHYFANAHKNDLTVRL